MADLEWAENANYAATGTPTKIAPDAALKAEGCVPEQANVSAQELNYMLHELCARGLDLPTIDVYTSADTHVIPATAVQVELILIGAGGSGGDGSAGGGGGAGGSRGAIVRRLFPADLLPISLNISPGGPTTVTGTGFLLTAPAGAAGGDGGATGGTPGAATTDYMTGALTGQGGAGSTGGVGSVGSAGYDAGGSNGSVRTVGGKGGLGYGAGGGGGGGVAGGGGGGAAGFWGLATIAQPAADGSNYSPGTGGAGQLGAVIVVTWHRHQ
jgi:hypothetical protein